jgi:hypothetical protein
MHKMTWIALGGALAIAGCNTGDEESDDLASTSEELRVSGKWVVYADPFLDGGANPAENVSGRVSVQKGFHQTFVSSYIQGAPPRTPFVAHAHLLACNDNKGGGHYQNSPDGGANPQNELWLSFQPLGRGDEFAFTHVNWRFRPDAGHAVVLHQAIPQPDGGVKAGAKLACINVPF